MPALPTGTLRPEDELRAFQRQHPFKDVNWQKVRAPRAWRPAVGAELLGYYHGRTVKPGKFGEYTAIQIMVPGEGIFLVSGAGLVQLIDAATPNPGDPLKIVFNGLKTLPGKPGQPEGEVWQKKQFDVYVARG